MPRVIYQDFKQIAKSMKAFPIPLLISCLFLHSIDRGGGLAYAAQERPLYFAISAMISSKETFSAYQGFLRYLSRYLGREVFLKQRRTYQEVNDLVRFGEVDVAFVCTGGYLEAKENFAAEILVVPVVRGKPYYNAFIIVNVDSPIRSFEGLRGKPFAFVDPLSNTGKLYPTYLVYRKGETLEGFFSSYFYTYSHDHSIESVAYQLVTGAAVDGLIYEYMRTLHPDVIGKTRVIKTSPDFGIPPIIASQGLRDQGLKEAVIRAFLYMHEDPEGRNVLKQLLIDRFIIPPKGLYRSASEMKKFLETYVKRSR